jgi:hypothetical protein
MLEVFFRVGKENGGEVGTLETKYLGKGFPQGHERYMIMCRVLQDAWSAAGGDF